MGNETVEEKQQQNNTYRKKKQFLFERFFLGGSFLIIQLVVMEWMEQFGFIFRSLEPHASKKKKIFKSETTTVWVAPRL